MPRFIPPLRPLVLALVVSVLSTVVLASASPASAAAPAPGTPRGLPAAIESQWIPYVAQTGCDPAFKKGTAALGRLLAATYHGVTVQGAYACGTDGPVSEHYQGRAIDWMTSLRNPQQAADANAFIKWLLATDRAGNKYAMARRLGVMYLIWNNRIWGGWDGKWAPYNNCAHQPQLSSDNACHRTHVHISLTWNGATARSSFWSKQNWATDYGPCRPRDLNWAGRYLGYNPRQCANYPAVQAPARSSVAAHNLVKYSGIWLAPGTSGPAVSAVQAVLRVPVSGQFLSSTNTAVMNFQRAHKVRATGGVDATTWRLLLRYYGH